MAPRATAGCGPPVDWRCIVRSTVEYRSHGVPLEEYELTRKDDRDQKTAVDIHAHVKKLVAEWTAEEAADPGLKEARQQNVNRAWEMLRALRTPDSQIVRWRIRLYCGHIAETQRHCEVEQPKAYGASSMRCPDCGMDPALIVAYEPMGPLAPPEGAFAGRQPLEPKSRKALERRLAKIEHEAAQIREQLSRPAE